MKVNLSIEQLKNIAKTFVEIAEIFPTEDAIGQIQTELNKYALSALKGGFVPEYMNSVPNEKNQYEFSEPDEYLDSLDLSAFIKN